MDALADPAGITVQRGLGYPDGSRILPHVDGAPAGLPGVVVDRRIDDGHQAGAARLGIHREAAAAPFKGVVLVVYACCVAFDGRTDEHQGCGCPRRSRDVDTAPQERFVGADHALGDGQHPLVENRPPGNAIGVSAAVLNGDSLQPDGGGLGDGDHPPGVGDDAFVRLDDRFLCAADPDNGQVFVDGERFLVGTAENLDGVAIRGGVNRFGDQHVAAGWRP